MAESKVRYTYRDLSHTQNFNEKGKRTVDLTQLFDVTYLGGLEYSRLLEVNGKPLCGSTFCSFRGRARCWKGRRGQRRGSIPREFRW